MIRGHRAWITARYEGGQLQVDLHGACLYLPEGAQNAGREVSVVMPATTEEAAAVQQIFDDILARDASRLQLKTTLAAADALSFAAKMGEVSA